ncbi:uncharacterized protein LOC132932391 [Rhopalosiphum padi]|uniref:uncharacterized protein LOC132932391 n=1 Tax=Rhopalosiphum padi TaxID=40932 RepID=UPI00298DB639|nr:uncharacterized protein LOC132932391 [Rhopalosiphum padi]
MLTLGFLALSYLMAAKNKLFPDRKMKEPERKDNEKISANNSNIMDKRSTATTPLQQAAKLLERSQQLLRAANSEAAVHATTAARVRRMSTAELRRDPVLWVAYTYGWDDRAAVFGKATNAGPKPAVTDKSRTASWHTATAVRTVAPTTPPTAHGSTGPTTKIVLTASIARDEESGPEKCPKANGRTDDNSATTKFEATPEPVSNAGIPGTEKGRQTHHLPTVPPGKTGTLNHPTGTRPKVAGGNQHACPRGQDTGGSNAYRTSRGHGTTGHRHFNTGRY